MQLKRLRLSDRTTSGDVVGGHMGAYGVATWGAPYAAGVVSYSRFDNWATRTIAGDGSGIVERPDRERNADRGGEEMNCANWPLIAPAVRSVYWVDKP